MAQGWNANVYRTDIQPEEYVGFYIDEEAAKAWIKKQREGTYEVSTQGPKKRYHNVEKREEGEK